MPEYLAPGVFVEEVSFRSKSIEGVATSTTGCAGLAAWGPVCYTDGSITAPNTCEPRLITSFREFETVYGGLDSLAILDNDQVGSTSTPRLPYLAHAARAFFENGGQRLYVSRVFTELDNGVAITGRDAWGIASATVAVSDLSARWQARWPGVMGNMFVQPIISRTKNIATTDNTGFVQASGILRGAVVEVTAPGGTAPVGNAPTTLGDLRVVSVDAAGVQTFVQQDGSAPALAANSIVQRLQLTIRVVMVDRVDEYAEIATAPEQKRYVGRILDFNDPEDENCPIWLDWDPEPAATAENLGFLPAVLLHNLRGQTPADESYGERLSGGHDGMLLSPNGLGGREADPDDPDLKATGLEALGEIDDIAIVMAPDTGDMRDSLVSRVAAQRLVTHAEKEKYRIAVVGGPLNSSLNEIRDFRGQFDSSYAAIYYPWIKVFDPNERFSQGSPPRQLALPPSGFITGIYARNDINRGVHKAPANEVIRGLTKFEININKPRNEVINPEGTNALRFFDGRGFRVWGARTMSSDPEWKYVNVRRLFIFIEHSIDLATQWAVFEPNNVRLWGNIRRMVEDFLLVQWRDGALLGAKPEDAFFVRCDRTTMTQNDLDNGCLICLIGIAPVKPAEFVIFRIGQWTADANT